MIQTMKCSAFNRAARFGRDHFTLLSVLLAGLGTAHILVRTATYGAAVTHDSSFLLSTALNFLAGEGWRNFRGDPLVGWAPLFPLLLAAGGWVGIDPLEVGRWINAIAFGLTIFVTGCYLRANLRSRGLALAATATLVAALPLSELGSHFLSDLLFTLLTLLALIQLATFLQRGGRMPLLWATVFTALAALTRYPGIVLIGTGVLLLLVRRTPPLAIRLKHAVAFGAVSSMPLAEVLTRNKRVSGTLTGDRGMSGQSLSDVLSRVADVLQAWVIPPNAPDGFGYLLWAAAGLVVAAGGSGGSRRGIRLGFGLADRTAVPLVGLGPIIPFGGFAVAYLLFIVAIVPLVVISPIPARYLLPVYVPLLLAAMFLLDRFLSSEAVGGWVAAKWGLASLVLLGGLAHVSFSAHRNLTITNRARVAGFEAWTYNAAYWESSETPSYIQDNRIGGKVYSNNAPLTWFRDRTAAPGKHQRLPDAIHNLTSHIMERTADDSSYIVWLGKEKPFYNYDAFDIRCLPGVEVVAELSDGVVFRVTASEPFDAEKHRAQRQRYVRGLIEQAGERVVRADWDVYLNGRKLTYRKKPCTPADTQAMFVLHITPIDPADLLAHRKPYGFNLLDFYFRSRNGVRLDDQCIAIVQLPDYDISRIRVGQWLSAENRTLWETTVEPFNSERHRAQRQRYVRGLIEQAGAPVVRADWDVYLNGRKLIYRKQPCAPVMCWRSSSCEFSLPIRASFPSSASGAATTTSASILTSAASGSTTSVSRASNSPTTTSTAFESASGFPPRIAHSGTRSFRRVEVVEE